MKPNCFLYVFVVILLVLEPMAVSARSGGGHSAPHSFSPATPRTHFQQGSSFHHAPQSFSQGHQSFGRPSGSSFTGRNYGSGSGNHIGHYGLGNSNVGVTSGGYSRAVGINNPSSAYRSTSAQRSSLQGHTGSEHQYGSFSQHDHGSQPRVYQRFDGHENHRQHFDPHYQPYYQPQRNYGAGYGFSVPYPSGFVGGGYYNDGGYRDQPYQPAPIVQCVHTSPVWSVEYGVWLCPTCGQPVPPPPTRVYYYEP